MIADPRAGAQAEDRLPIQAARCGEVDILERGWIPQLRMPEPLGQAPALARGPFGVDEQAEAVVETERGILARAALLVKRLGHRRQAQRVELLDGRIRQHTSPRSRWRRARSRA